MQKQFYSIAEISNILGISTVTIRKLIKNQTIPAIKIGKMFKIPICVVENWKNSNEVTHDIK